MAVEEDELLHMACRRCQALHFDGQTECENCGGDLVVKEKDKKSTLVISGEKRNVGPKHECVCVDCSVKKNKEEKIQTQLHVLGGIVSVMERHIKEGGGFLFSIDSHLNTDVSPPKSEGLTFIMTNYYRKPKVVEE